MKQTDPQFKLRLPPSLKERLDDAAVANERTLTAEIVARLQNTFDQGMPASPDAPTIYLLIDSHGYPQSWSEVTTMWEALVKGAGLDVVKLDAVILTPDLESSSARTEQVVALAKKLRKGGKSTLLPKGA